MLKSCRHVHRCALSRLLLDHAQTGNGKRAPTRLVLNFPFTDNPFAIRKVNAWPLHISTASGVPRVGFSGPLPLPEWNLLRSSASFHALMRHQTTQKGHGSQIFF